MDDAEIAAIVRRAARTLAERAGTVVLTTETIADCEVEVSSSGWCELGRIADAEERCSWTVLYHPATKVGRLVRKLPRAKRGIMGEILSTDAD